MSYESRQIDGDLSVGHNTAIGGDAIVRGKTHLQGNVKVDGWLEAKNIKGVSKGLYPTIEALKAAIPSPILGDWAIVGKTIPGSIFHCETKGVWSATGMNGGGGSIDLSGYVIAEEIDDVTSI